MSEIATKTCSKCGETKPVGEFRPRHPMCHVCKNEAYKRHDKKCIECGVEFLGLRHQKTCSPECRRKRQLDFWKSRSRKLTPKERRRNNPPKKYPDWILGKAVLCVTCGGLFESKTPWQKCCSAECRRQYRLPLNRALMKKRMAIPEVAERRKKYDQSPKRMEAGRQQRRRPEVRAKDRERKRQRYHASPKVRIAQREAARRLYRESPKFREGMKRSSRKYRARIVELKTGLDLLCTMLQLGVL